MRFSLLAVLLTSAASLSCSDDVPPTAKAFIATTVGPGSDVDDQGQAINGSAQCRLNTQEWVAFGRSDEGGSLEYETKQGEDTIGISYEITPAGDGFQVTASATKSPGGTFTLIGNVKSSGASQPVQGSFNRADTGLFKQKDCVVEFKNANHGVAPGKVWGYITCPRATLDAQGRTCLAQGEFKFENCDK